MAPKLGCARGWKDDVDPQPGPGEDLEPAPLVSGWFQSDDDGRTWSPPRLLLTDPIIEDPSFGSEFLGPKFPRRGDVVATPDGVTAVVFGGRHRLESDDPRVPNNGEVVELLPMGGPS